MATFDYFRMAAIRQIRRDQAVRDLVQIVKAEFGLARFQRVVRDDVMTITLSAGFPSLVGRS